MHIILAFHSGYLSSDVGYIEIDDLVDGHVPENSIMVCLNPACRTGFWGPVQTSRFEHIIGVRVPG
jgi:hypothetical protein